MSDDEGQILTMADLAAALNRIRIRKGMTLMELNDMAELQGGYANKIFAGMKSLGPLTLPPILRALGCELKVILAPSKNNGSGRATESCEVVHMKERKRIATAGGHARAIRLSPERRREIARLGGLARKAKYEAARAAGVKIAKKMIPPVINGDNSQGELF